VNTFLPFIQSQVWWVVYPVTMNGNQTPHDPNPTPDATTATTTAPVTMPFPPPAVDPLDGIKS